MPDWVLVVDDDPNIAALVVERLESVGFSATAANDAMQAVIQAESLRPVLVVMDMQMPGFGSGADAVRAMRSNQVLKAVPIVILTGMDLNQAAKMLPSDPLTRLLGKPMDWPLLVKAIQELTRGKYPRVQPQPAAGAAPAAAKPPPAQPAPAPIPAQAAPAPAPKPKLERSVQKVLVIDDETPIRDLIAAGLSKSYQVLTAENGKKGLEIARSELPDLILCDVVMPELTGAEVLRQLQLDPTLFYTPVVMMTAAALDAATQAMFQKHPNVRHWLRKPFDLQTLARTVASVLGAKPASQPMPVVQAAAVRARRYTILMVEDDVPFFQFLILGLHRDDLVYRALDGMQALERLKTVTPDLIIADIMMPRMSGIEILRVLQRDSTRSRIPVILLTAVHLQPKQVEVMKKDFPNLRFVIEKPCDVKTLRNAVDSILVRDLAP